MVCITRQVVEEGVSTCTTITHMVCTPCQVQLWITFPSRAAAHAREDRQAARGHAPQPSGLPSQLAKHLLGFVRRRRNNDDKSRKPYIMGHIGRIGSNVADRYDDDDDDDIGGFASKLHRRLSTATPRSSPAGRRHARPDGRANVAVVVDEDDEDKVSRQIARRKERATAAGSPSRLRDPGAVVPRQWLADLDRKEKASAPTAEELERLRYEEYMRLQLTDDATLGLSCIERVAMCFPLWAAAPLLLLLYLTLVIDFGPALAGMKEDLR